MERSGKGMAADFRASAKRLGLQLVSNRHSNCTFYAGITASGAMRNFKSAPKQALLFGGDGVAGPAFTAHLPKRVAKRTFVTVDTLPAQNYGLAAHADAYRAYGFEAMKLILDGIAAGATTTEAMTAWCGHTLRFVAPITAA